MVRKAEDDAESRAKSNLRKGSTTTPIDKEAVMLTVKMFEVLEAAKSVRKMEGAGNSESWKSLFF